METEWFRQLQKLIENDNVTKDDVVR